MPPSSTMLSPRKQRGRRPLHTAERPDKPPVRRLENLSKVHVHDLATQERSLWWRYSIALISAAGAMAFRLLLNPWLGSHAPYVECMVAVAVTVWLAGFWPAIVTAALGVPVALIFVISENEPWLAKAIGVGVYALAMLSLALLGKSMRTARHEALEAAADARRGQEEAARARRQWEQTFDTVPDLVAIMNPSHQIVLANRAMSDRLKIDKSACPGLTCYHAVHDLDAPVQACPHALAMADGQEHVAEVYEERLGGYYLVSCTPMRNGQGLITGTVHVARDITAMKRSQEALQQSEQLLRAQAKELTRSNQDLEQFAHTASHDLKEPLGVITMYLTLLKRKHGAALDEQASQFVAHAMDAVGRMGCLINDLLAYSRVGHKTEGFRPVDVQEVLDYALSNLKARIDGSGAVITHDPLPDIEAERLLLTQLLQNLISNAIKYRSPQVRPEIHVGASREQGQWVFSVRDNGVGIAAADHERIFAVFQRAHQMADAVEGTGIGLAICKKIVDYHGGRIWVQSQPGQGSTFFFTIPDSAQR
ncbi:MAG: PAS domain-containing protein [Planctomycetaceae bacterium]|nr:PAS domain-containing protein [Planctomycetaceae bacterium]